ncbi:hypothetical protein Mgra_00010026 [Meloidogyne graminicola]|uniref:Uncharacterized protein n=1 Tax=Meloidogyne graminicola TaxID=189291 RepID=A0A8S9ZD42_9BILA|nr:hypothetical protein Mgra_00010026 [Meloidogyne graminicola]
MKSWLCFSMQKQLEKATDFSKVVSNINFLLRSQEWPSSELIVKGVETSESTKNIKYYEITNNRDPKMKLLWICCIDESDLIDYIVINKIIC